MPASHHLRPLVVVALVLFPVALSCAPLEDTFTPRRHEPRAPNAALDEPPPLHTGGLDVLTVDASTGRQGPGDSSGSHGDPTAEAIATGVGVMAIGTTAATTAAACAQPNASAECLRGPGPADNAAAPPDPAPIAPVAPTPP